MGSRPDRAFRIADRRHPLLDGTGAMLYGGRWNSPGRRVIYAADTFAGALLEILIHARIGAVPRTQVWIEIEIPPAIGVEVVHSGQLPGWLAEESPAAREFGDLWHEQQRTPILVVPSVVTSGIGSNVLINPGHPEFGKLQASAARDVLWDVRLFPTIKTRRL